MGRDEWLAVLQGMSWSPCKESGGLPRYRASAAYYCTFCAYTVCAGCYNMIPTALLFSSKMNSANGANKCPSGPPCEVFGDEEFGRPRCLFCRKGELIFEEVPVFEWTCEGPRPARRLQRGAAASYDVDVMQRYYTMKEQRDKRVLSTEPLVAQFHGAEGPPARFCFADDFERSNNTNNNGINAVDSTGGGCILNRHPFCEEGSSFFFSVQNPRLEVSCVWCAVNRRPVETHPSLVGDEAITPLQTFRCPSSLPGIPPRRFCVYVPYGAYGLHNVHALALCLEDDIFQRASHDSQVSDESKAITEAVLLRPQSGQPGTLKKHKLKKFQPLLLVDILHRIATSDPVRDLLPARWLALCARGVSVGDRTSAQAPELSNMLAFTSAADGGKATELPSADGADSNNIWRDNAISRNPNCSSNDNISNDKNDGDGDQRNTLPHCEVPDNVSVVWPDRLRCGELLLTIDYLLQGRSVAVYGIASKYFFLQHVLQSAELRYHNVAVIDGYCTPASRMTHQLRDIERSICQLRQLSEQEFFQSGVIYDLWNRSPGVDNCFVSTEREQQGEKPQGDQPFYHSVPSTFTESFLRSQSYCIPLHGSIKEKDGGQNQSPKFSRNGVADDTKETLFPMPSHFGNTQPLPPRVTTECAHVCVESTSLQNRREDSILLVHEEEANGAEISASRPHVRAVRVCSDSQPHLSASDKHLLSRFGEGLGSSVRVWSRRYCLHEQSEWNYRMPLVRNKHRSERPCGELRKRRRMTSTERRENTPVYAKGECDMLLSESFCGPRLCSPRFSFSSSELMHSLYSACFAPFRACVDWISLPSLTAKRLIPAVQSSGMVTCASLPSRGVRMTIIAIHGVDQLDVSSLFELQRILREHPYHVLLLCSFDDPNWVMSSAAAFLNQHRLVCVELRSVLLPRVHEMSAVDSLSLFTELEASACSVGKFNRHANRGGGAFSAAGTLPLYDTIRRILFSLPATFSELLRCMIARQEVSGENAFVPMSLHQEHFYERGMMVSVARLRAIERELTSNRLAVFDAAENKLMIPQHRKLLRVLEEVLEQRRVSENTTGRAAPIEA